MAPNAPKGAEAGAVPTPGAIRLNREAIVECCKLVAAAACRADGAVDAAEIMEFALVEAGAVGVDSDSRPKLNGSL